MKFFLIKHPGYSGEEAGDMKINITNLAEGEHVWDFTEKGEAFDIEYLNPDSEVNIHVVLFKTNNQLDLNVTVKGNFNLQCDRCLDPYEVKFDTAFDLIYKIDFTGEVTEDDSDDVLKYISPRTKTIDIRDDVRDYLMLSIPMRKVPEDSDGTCLFCNRKISDILEIKRPETLNPVWEKLLKIKSK